MMGSTPCGVAARRTCTSSVTSFERVTHAPADPRALYSAIRQSLSHLCRAAPGSPNVGSRMVREVEWNLLRASVVSGRPVDESSLTFASRGRLATPSGTSRPRCSDSGWVVAAVVGASVWVGAGRSGGRLGGPLLGCARLCDHAATISSSTVPQIQFIDSGWIFLCRDGYPQCKVCR